MAITQKDSERKERSFQSHPLTEDVRENHRCARLKNIGTHIGTTLAKRSLNPIKRCYTPKCFIAVPAWSWS